MKSIRKRMGAYCALGVAFVCSGAVRADGNGIAWPSDFWQQVTNRITSVAPVPSVSAAAEGFSSSGTAVTDVDPSLGSSTDPFDSRLFLEAESDVLSVNSFPRGLAFVLR